MNFCTCSSSLLQFFFFQARRNTSLYLHLKPIPPADEPLSLLDSQNCFKLPKLHGICINVAICSEAEMCVKVEQAWEFMTLALESKEDSHKKVTRVYSDLWQPSWWWILQRFLPTQCVETQGRNGSGSRSGRENMTGARRGVFNVSQSFRGFQSSCSGEAM